MYLSTRHPAGCFCDLNPINRLNAILLELIRLKTAGTWAIIMGLPPKTQPVVQYDYQKKEEDKKKRSSRTDSVNNLSPSNSSSSMGLSYHNLFSPFICRKPTCNTPPRSHRRSCGRGGVLTVIMLERRGSPAGAA